MRRILRQTRGENAGEAIQSAAAGSAVHQRCGPGCTRRFVLWDIIREEQSLSLANDNMACRWCAGLWRPNSNHPHKAGRGEHKKDVVKTKERCTEA